MRPSSRAGAPELERTRPLTTFTLDVALYGTVASRATQSSPPRGEVGPAAGAAQRGCPRSPQRLGDQRTGRITFRSSGVPAPPDSNPPIHTSPPHSPYRP